MTRPWASVVLPGIAVAVAAWSLVPLAVWWDNANPSYFTTMWQTWGWGSAVAALALVLALVLSQGRVTDAALLLWRRVVAIPAPRFLVVMAALIAVETAFFSTVVFDGNPRNVDGFAQLFQARIFLAGRLWAPPPPPAELANFATLQMITGPARWFSQYPPGQSLVLAAGLALGRWWLFQPLLAGLFLVFTYRVARWCADEAAARLAALLLCASPFVVAVAGSEMSHLAAAALGMAAAAAATWAATRHRASAAALTGLGLGAMTAFRPLDAVAAAVPVGVILLGWSERRWRGLWITACVGVLATLPTLWYNAQTTGSWHLFGYTYLWGPEHSLGFHPVPWGVALTPLRAVARSGLDLHQLNAYLLDATVPALLVVAGGWTAGRRHLTSRDALPWAGALALSALLFLYWHRDVFYGPRFLYSAVAWWLVLLARGVVLLRRSSVAARPRLGATLGLAVAVSVLVGLVAVTPGRVKAYRQGTPLFSLHPDRDARRAGVHHALVVIPDGWGSRLIARMWQLGVPVRRSTRLYAAIDACTLEQALGRAERDPAARTTLSATLDSLASRNQPGVASGATEDANLRLPADGRLAPACAAEIETDRRGFAPFAPFLYLNTPLLDGDIVWARDMGPRNLPLLRRYADRRIYRYAPSAPGSTPVLMPIGARSDVAR